MRLPKSEGGGKKGAPAGNKKKDIKLSPEHLALERVDLSGFRHRRFSRAGFRELLEGLSLLPCLRTVILRDNGLNEDCESEVLELF